MKRKQVLIALLSLVVASVGLGCDRGSSDGTERDTTTTAADFCEEHQIAEAKCPFCDPGLIESLGFCNGHGVPEAFCFRCDPDLIPAFKAVGDWCAGHDRPESQCYICNPQLDPARQEPPAGQTPAGATQLEESPGADAYQGSYASRKRQPPSASCSTQSLIVRFDSSDVVDQAGFDFATVEYRPLTKSIECNAEIVYDGNRYARIGAQIPGIVMTIHKDLGDRVELGEPLVTISSTHLGAAKASYLQAAASVALWERNHAREVNLLACGAATERELFEAESRLAEGRISLSAAEQALLGFGLLEGEIDDIRRTGDTGVSYAVTAPYSGLVVDRQVTVGEFVNPSRTLYSIADVSSMWALMDIHESEMRHVQVGQPAVLQIEGLPGEPASGRITWVSSRLDPQTRTLRARAELDNGGGGLRANMFAAASISVRDRAQTLVVPEAAVQWEGCCNIVFVKRSETVYEPRKVHLGVKTGTVHEVLGGIGQGEEVVTQGSFLLKTEILKNSIGAGCCEVDPGA